MRHHPHPRFCPRPVGSALLLVVAAALLSSCAARSSVALPAESWEPGPPEEEILALVNAYRGAQGLPGLTPHPALTNVARQHSEAMLSGAAPFGHDGIEQRAALVARQITFMSFGENLLEIGPPSNFSARRALGDWLGSGPHRAQIEGCFDLTGIGIARNEERVVVTQLFALSTPVRFTRWSNPCG